MLDLNICTFKELIECAFGEPENNAVNFKGIQTILYLLARQLGVLDRLVQVDLTSEQLPSPSRSSITVSEIKIKATATHKKIKPKDANVKAITRKEDLERKISRSPTSKDTSVQSRSPSLKTKYATQGWPYNPSLDDDIENAENAKEISHNSTSEKNKEKNKTIHKIKTSDKKIKRITNTMEYGNEQSSRYQVKMESRGKFQNTEQYEQEQLKLEKLKQVLLSKSSGYCKETSVSISSTKEVDDSYGKQNNISISQGNEKEDSQIETIKDQSPRNNFAIFEKNKEYKESTNEGEEKKKDNTRENNSLKDDFISYIGSLEDIVSITERDIQHDSPKEKSYHKSSYDEIIYKPQRIYERNLSDERLESMKTNKKAHYRSLSEENCGLKCHKYYHQKYYSFLERDRYDRSNSKSLHRSSSDEVISKINKYQEHNSDKDKSYEARNQSQSQERKKTFDFNKYIELDQPSFKELIAKDGKDHEDERITEHSRARSIKSKNNYTNTKPLYTNSEEELYKHYKGHRSEEKTSGYENNEQSNIQFERKQTRMSKYQKFYQSSVELISEYYKNPHEDRHRGQSEPTEMTQRVKKECSKRDKKLESSLGYENRKDKDKAYLGPSIKDCENNLYKSLREEHTHNKVLSAQDDTKLSNKKRYLPSTLEDISTQKNTEKIRPNYYRENKQSYDNAKNQPDNVINSQERQTLSTDIKETTNGLQEKQTSDTFNKNMSLFEKLIHAIMAKCHRENETIEQKMRINENAQPVRKTLDKVSYSSLEDAFLSKSPEYSRHKSGRKEKPKLNKSDTKKHDYSASESIIKKDNVKTSGLDYLKTKFTKKRSDRKDEKEEGNTQDENQYPSSSDEETSEKFKQIKEYYTEISENEKASIKNWRYSKEDKDQQDRINRSVSEEPIPRRTTGVGGDSLDKEESQRKRGSEKRAYDYDKSTTVMSSYDKLRQAIMAKCNLKQHEDIEPPKDISNEADEKYAILKSQRDAEKNRKKIHEKRQKDRSSSEETFVRSSESPNSRKDKASQPLKTKEYDSYRDRSKQYRSSSEEDLEHSQINARKEGQAYLKAKQHLQMSSEELIIRRVKKQKETADDSKDESVRERSLPKEITTRRDMQGHIEDEQQYQFSSEEIIRKRGEIEEKTPDYEKERFNKDSTASKKLYEGHPKEYQKPSDSRSSSEEDLERSQINARKEGQAYLIAKQHLQTRPEELIIRRVKKQKETADDSKDESVRERSLPKEITTRRDMQGHIEDEQQYQFSSEELIRKRGKIEEKTPDYEKERFNKDGAASKKVYDGEDHPKEYQKPSDSRSSSEEDLERSQINARKEGEAYLKAKQPLQTSSEELIIRRVKKQKETADDSKDESVRERSLPKEITTRRDMQGHIEDEQQYQFSSEEIIRKRGKIEEKTPDYEKERFNKDGAASKKLYDGEGHPKEYQKTFGSEPKGKQESHEYSREKQQHLSSSEEIIKGRTQKRKESVEIHENRERKRNEDYDYDSRDQFSSEETMTKKHRRREKDPDPEEMEKIRLTRAIFSKSSQDLAKKTLSSLADEDVKSKLARQRAALFAKCPGFETESILKRDNLIYDKINRSISEDESQDYDHNKNKSRAEAKNYFSDNEAQYYKTKDKKHLHSLSYEEDISKRKKHGKRYDDTGENKAKQKTKGYDDEAIPRPKQRGKRYDDSEENKAKQKNKGYDDEAISKLKRRRKRYDDSEEKEAKQKGSDRPHEKVPSPLHHGPSKDKEVNGLSESIENQINDRPPTRQHHRSSSGKQKLKHRESSTSIGSEPRKQDLSPSFSDLGDWHIDPSVIITKTSKGSDILNDKERDKYKQGKESKREHGSERRREKEEDRSDETIVGKRTKVKYNVDREELKGEKDKSRRDTRSQEEKDKYSTNQTQKRKEKKDKYSHDDSMGSIIEENSDNYSSDESFKSEREQRRRKTSTSEKSKTKDKTHLDAQADRRDTLKSGVDSASSKRTDEYSTNKKDAASRYSTKTYKKVENEYADTELDKTKDLLRSSDSAETKRPDATEDSIESKDIEKKKYAYSKKDGAKLKDGKSFEVEKQKQVDDFKDSKKFKDSAKLDSKTGDSQKSMQYHEDDGSHARYEDEAKKQRPAISDGTKGDYAKHVQSEDLLAPEGQMGSKGGKKLDIHGVPLEVFEELREQELRVINQRADSREEPDREPSRMLSVPSAEKALAHSTKEGQKGKGKADTKAAPGKLGRRPSQDIEEEKILVVERIPLDKEKAREYKEKHQGTPLAVVRLEEFEALVKEVKELDARIRPPSRYSFPGNAELLEHIRNGASLTEAMGALQLSARIEAAENALENIIEMVTKLASQNPEVDIDIHGEPISRLPATQQAPTVTSQPMDYLGFDALATQQKGFGGAVCREECVTKPEFDQQILMVQKELAKEIGDSAKKNLSKIESLAKNLKHLESKVEDAVNMGNRMADLEDLVAGYSERINAMDTGLSVQMTSYQDQLTQMQHELEEGLETMAETLANAEGDPAAVAELHVKLNIFQDDLVNIANIQSELGRNEQDVFVNLKDLFTQIEHLRETKADREEVEDALQNKAGLSDLNGLISLEHFDALIGDMEGHIGKAYDKFNNQELIWQKAINDLVKELNEKTNLEIVLNLRDDINKKLNMIMERIGDLHNIVGEPKAFGTTKRINVGAECLSCKTPAQMEPEAKPSRMPAMKTSSASGDGAYRKEAGDACYPGHPIPHPLDQRTHICNRYCGGSHTVLKNVSRAKSLPGAVTIKKWEKSSSPGSVTKPYMVENPSVRGPCQPCNIVPSVSTIEMIPKPAAPVKGRAVFDIEIRDSEKCPCFNVEPELDSDLTLTG